LDAVETRVVGEGLDVVFDAVEKLVVLSAARRLVVLVRRAPFGVGFSDVGEGDL
jgi:hypothetical protein